MSARRLLSSSTAITLALAIGVPQASAQTAQKSGGLEEIVVTARKRTEKLQKVPVAVTALGTAQLAQNKIISTNDLAQVVPSLTFQQSSYSSFGALVGIRGQKTEDTVLSQTPSIGIYVDDVYVPATIGTGLGNLFDTRSIEVLKGPQGTLYGRNTTGGAVKIESNLPDYKGVYGAVTVGFGNYSSNNDALMLNVPVIADVAAFRLVLERNYNGGYGHDNTNDRPLGDQDAKSGRFSFRFDPSEDFHAILRASWQDGRSGDIVANLEEIKPVFGPGGVPTFSPALLNTGLEIGSISFRQLLPLLEPSVFGPPTPQDIGAVLAGQQVAYNALKKYLRQGYNVNYSDPQSNRLKNDSLSATESYNVTDSITVKSITSYQYAGTSTNLDVDASPFRILEGPADQISLDQFSQELQLSGHAFGNRLQYTAGFYYYYLTGNDDSPGEQELPFLNVTGSPVDTRDHLFDTSKAVYAQASYALIPDVHLTLGGRYTDEKTELVTHSTAGPAHTCNIPPPAGTGSVPCAGDFNNPFTNFSYLAGLDWSVTDDILLYTTTSRGFKAGGENQRGDVLGGYAPFSPEIVTQYEIGLKSDFLAHKVRLNVAAYHSDYKDIQRSVLAVLPGEQTVTEIQNAAAATINGVETELTVRPVQSLILNFNSAYTLPKYSKYVSGGVNLSGNAFQDQPLWQLNLGGTYTHDLALGTLPATFTGTVNFSYQSSVSLGPDNLSIYSNSYTNQPGYGLLNTRLALDIPKYAVTLEFFGKNLTDRKYLTGQTDLTAALGTGVAYLSNPLTFGFDVTKRF